MMLFLLRAFAIISLFASVFAVGLAQSGTVQFSQPLFTASEAGPIAHTEGGVKYLTPTMTVTRTGSGTGALTVDYCVWPSEVTDNAVESVNYVLADNMRRWVAAGTLSWADGDTAPKSVPFTYSAFGQTRYNLTTSNTAQGTITYSARLTNLVGGVTLGANSTARLEILDAETPAAGALNLTARRFYGAEGDSAVISVRRDGRTTGAVSVNYATSSTLPAIGSNQHGIAAGVSGTHYAATSGTLTWSAGDDGVKTFTIPLPATGNTDGTMHVAINLSAPAGGAVLGTGSSALLTIQHPASTVFDINDNTDRSTYRVSLPPGAGPIRGVLFWWPGTNGDDRHFTTDPAFRKVADLWRFAVVSPRGNYDSKPNRFEFPQPRLGFFFDRLAQIAQTTGRPEIAHAPFVLSGMSAGSYTSSSSLNIWPERTIAIVGHQGWNYPTLPLTAATFHALAKEIPALNLGGQLEGTQSPPSAIFPAMNEFRKGGVTRSAVVMCWGRPHTFDNTYAAYNAIGLYWLDQVMAAGRYPASSFPTATSAPALGALPLSAGWWGARNSTNSTVNSYELPGGFSRYLAIGPDATYVGVKDPANALVDSWLPTESAARAYRAFVSLPTIAFNTPAQFSGGLVGQAVPLAINENGFGAGVTKVEFYDGSTKIGEDLTAPYALSWSPTQAGPRSLTAVASNNSGPLYSAFTLFLAGNPVAPVITAGQTTSGVRHLPFSYQLAADGPPTGYALIGGQLPPGVTLDSGTGVLAGTPGTSGAYAPVFTATNTMGTSPPVSVSIIIHPASTALADEAFNYPAGSGSLAGQNGGNGWSSAWSSATNAVNATGLAYTSGADTLVTSGGRAVTDSHRNSFRTLPAGYTSGTHWFSFLARSYNPGNSYGGLSLFDGTGLERVFFGQPSNAATWGIAGGSLLLNHGSGTQAFIVVRVVLGAGNDTATLWVNPGLASTPTDATATSVRSAEMSFDRLRIASGTPMDFDEIRFGPTFFSVAPITTPPDELAVFRATHGLAPNGTQDTATPAGDGVANLLKYAFNLVGPGQAESLDTPNAITLAPDGVAGLPFCAVSTAGPDSGKLQITYIRRKATSYPGITYAVEFSDSLVAESWAPNIAATESATSLDDTFERVTVTDSTALPTRRFVRLKISAQ